MSLQDQNPTLELRDLQLEAPQQQPQHQQPQQPQPDVATTAAASNCPSSVWLPEIVDCIASFLPSNEIPATLRLVNRATADQFRGKDHTTLRARRAVPPHAFAAQWGNSLGGAAAVRGLARSCRLQLEWATASSGSIENLQVLLAWADYFPLTGVTMAHAASGGHVAVCAWLKGRGCPMAEHGLEDVVSRGDEAMAMWLIRNGYHYLADDYGTGFALPGDAARGGHLALMNELCKLQPPEDINSAELVRGSAEGLPLQDLQRHHHVWLEKRGRRLGDAEVSFLIASAALSHTPDWSDKLTWLLRDCGYARGGAVPLVAPHLFTERVVDLGARLRELHARHGFALGLAHINLAAERGDGDLLEYLLTEAGVKLHQLDAHRVLRAAARGGHLSFLQTLHAHALLPLGGGAMALMLLESAAGCGWLKVLEWVAEAQGALAAPPSASASPPAVAAEAAGMQGAGGGGARLTASVAAAAASSGAVGGGYLGLSRGTVGGGEGKAALRWLRARGCPWNAEVFTRAVGGGDFALLSWMREEGCPWDGGAYSAAGQLHGGAVEMCEWLAERGCPMDEAVFMSAAEAEQNEGVLEFLAARGCPMPTTGMAYLRSAFSTDWPVLRCLRRLGCSLGDGTDLFTHALVDPKDYAVEDDNDDEYDEDFYPPFDLDRGPHGAGLPVLRWLVEQGCRVDEGDALRMAEYRKAWAPDIHAWVVGLVAGMRLQGQA